MKELSGLASYRRKEGWLGRDVRYFPTVSSTNDVAVQLAEQGVEEGLVILADEQTNGRGRGQRRWFAPAGTSLLVSLLFRPREPFGRQAPRITMLAGIALVESVRERVGVPVLLKWPNDLIVERDGTWKKVAGMLSEVGGVGPDYLVIGIGLNVNVAAEDLQVLSPRAISLSIITGYLIDRVVLLDAFLARTERLLQSLREGWDPLPRWRALLSWMGRAVEVRTPTDVVQGIAETVAKDGALIVRTSGGNRRRFSVGDVSLRKARAESGLGA